jgi:hypothetical protein
MAYIRGRADKGTLDKLAKYSSDNSFHAKSKSEKMGGAPSEQNTNKGNYTARETRANCGPIGRYPGSNQDRGGASNGYLAKTAVK